MDELGGGGEEAMGDQRGMMGMEPRRIKGQGAGTGQEIGSATTVFISPPGSRVQRRSPEERGQRPALT
jgi:hypothetical protein